MYLNDELSFRGFDKVLGLSSSVEVFLLRRTI